MARTGAPKNSATAARSSTTEQRGSAPRKARPLIQMIVADRFEPDAFSLARSAGMIAATPENLFGREIAGQSSKFRGLLADRDFGAGK